ncbi:OmpH family outer membrane protein [Rhodopirellula sp.]|jgi:Skp family chaperone for outer membrane proteins|nr:OmpH family outer membrane protein [Rhodopirellula sp.]
MHRDSTRTHNARRADVRLFGKKALLLATVSLTLLAPSFAQGQDAAHRIAVVDVAHIFKNHPGIKAQVEKVESDLKAYDAQLQAKREELKQAAEQLKAYKVGSAEYAAQEELVASMESKLRLDMARTRKELADAEAKIYFQNYKLIADGVKFLANHYKINLVLRYNSEDMDLANGESVIRGVMKNIVYHDESLDMTKGVMQYLDQSMKTANSGSVSTK